jgi:hypothetical protein
MFDATRVRFEISGRERPLFDMLCVESAHPLEKNYQKERTIQMER